MSNRTTASLSSLALFVSLSASAQTLPDASYRPLPTRPFAEVKADDEASKADVFDRQKTLIEERYDLSDRPTGVMMSG